MVRQIPSTELAEEVLKNHCSYFYWLCQESGIGGPLARLFFNTDFRWVDSIPDDENRAKEAQALREQYAIFLVAGEAKSTISEEAWKKIDRLKKSILGPTCVFEVFVCLARNLDDLLNMEPESKVRDYFARMMENAGFDFYEDDDWDGDAEKVERYWKTTLDRVLDRTYLPDGEGGLFPLDTVDGLDFDQRKRSLWSQLNDWADQEMSANDEGLGDVFE